MASTRVRALTVGLQSVRYPGRFFWQLYCCCTTARVLFFPLDPCSTLNCYPIGLPFFSNYIKDTPDDAGFALNIHWTSGIFIFSPLVPRLGQYLYGLFTDLSQIIGRHPLQLLKDRTFLSRYASIVARGKCEPKIHGAGLGSLFGGNTWRLTLLENRRPSEIAGDRSVERAACEFYCPRTKQRRSGWRVVADQSNLG